MAELQTDSESVAGLPDETDPKHGRTMKGHWYCNDCEERISKEEVSDHEDDGHEVKGHFQPDRLVPGDPDMLGSGVDTAGDGGES